ncbi:uncharacterized protein LOC101742173 [Bombyx mori]|uniref:Uncharacterized protein n=1 Tax=Bombyx mori TaxID=7091 RepID=A0A8R2C982_BOMMO|nr:uncharacterized protein LOC101742173 [Bombyx mori]
MRQSILLILAVCAFAAANVPKDRLQVTDTAQPTTQTTEATETTGTAEMTQASGNKPIICAPTTPCAWTVYSPVSKMIQTNMTNRFCICSADTTCAITEDDTEVHAYIHRCTRIDPDS